jgi:hypothetical protein
MGKPTPLTLYKYQSFDQYALINLIKRQLYFSKPANFNDPFDCNPPFEIVKDYRTEKNLKAFYEKIKKYEIAKSGLADSFFDIQYMRDGKPNKRFERDFIDSPKHIKEQIEEKTGVVCFSESVENFLLWSHYANKHKGFCLEFDTATLLSSYAGSKLYEVKYVRASSPIRLHLSYLLKSNALELLLTRKSHLWKYEKEWRMFCDTGGDKLYTYNPAALTKVYFGHNMSLEDKTTILSIIKGTQIIPYFMGMDMDKFEVTQYPFRGIPKK